MGTKYVPVNSLTTEWSRRSTGMINSAAERAATGGGFLPYGERNALIRRMSGAIDRQTGESLTFLRENMNRMIPVEDTSVRQWAENRLTSSASAMKADLPNKFNEIALGDMAGGMDLGINSLGTELGMSSQMSNMNNQQMQSMYDIKNRYGTFNSNLMGGVGSGLGYAGYSLLGKNNPAIQFGGLMSRRG